MNTFTTLLAVLIFAALVYLAVMFPLQTTAISIMIMMIDKLTEKRTSNEW